VLLARENVEKLLALRIRYGIPPKRNFLRIPWSQVKPLHRRTRLTA